MFGRKPAELCRDQTWANRGDVGGRAYGRHSTTTTDNANAVDDGRHTRMSEYFSPFLEAGADWKLLPLPGGQTKYWTWLFPLTWGPLPAPGRVGGTGVPGRVMG